MPAAYINPKASTQELKGLRSSTKRRVEDRSDLVALETNQFAGPYGPELRLLVPTTIPVVGFGIRGSKFGHTPGPVSLLWSSPGFLLPQRNPWLPRGPIRDFAGLSLPIALKCAPNRGASRPQKPPKQTYLGPGARFMETMV